jgi:hypothetical protein
MLHLALFALAASFADTHASPVRLGKRWTALTANDLDFEM